jgi:hypothetical protein
MPHFICRWPCGDVLLACVDNRQELDQILQASTTIVRAAVFLALSGHHRLLICDAGCSWALAGSSVAELEPWA